jgi:hypothetical protein
MITPLSLPSLTAETLLVLVGFCLAELLLLLLVPASRHELYSIVRGRR